MARMNEYTALSEIGAVMDDALDWLRSYPGDDRMAAAMQRLEEKRMARRPREGAELGERSGLRRRGFGDLGCGFRSQWKLGVLHPGRRCARYECRAVDVGSDAGFCGKNETKPERKMMEATT